MDKNIQLVIAIDFGTSRSGFAYAYVGDKEAHAREDWPDMPARYPKTDTHLLYNPDGQVIAWGYQALNEYAKLRQKGQHKGYHFLKNFKMALYENKEGNVGENLRLIFKNGQRILLKENIEDHQKKEFPVLNLIVDYLRYLKNFALKIILDEATGHVKEKQILWCLTVPAIWEDQQKQLMRQAAIQAGLISNTSLDAERLIIVLEPEAAAVHCLESDTRFRVSELRDGSTFMIIDAGGGTVDITVHEVVSTGEQKSLEEVVPGLGGAYGSIYIDNEFEKYITSLLTVEVMQAILLEMPVAFRKMMSDWEAYKCSFTGEREDDVTYIWLPIDIYHFLSERYPDILLKLAKVQDGTDDAIVLDNSTMHNLFRPIIDGVEKLVEKQFALIGSRGCNFIFLVGGFSRSPLLQKRIEEKFCSRVQKVVKPHEPGAAIEFGAASLGLDPSVIRARRTRLTYGMDCAEEFDPDIDPLSKRINNPKGGFLCKERFNVFVTAGEKIAIDESVTFKYVPVEADQRDMPLGIYISKSPKVRYVDDRGTRKIGDLRITRDNVRKGYDWTVKVTMRFGKSEIQAEAEDPESGEKVKTEVQFLSTYFPEYIGLDEET